MSIADRPGVSPLTPGEDQLDLLAQYGGLIFDCDGTLTDSMPVHYRAWSAAMTAVGIDFSEDRFYQLAGIPTDKIIEIIASEQSVEVDVSAAAADKERHFLEIASSVEPMPPVLSIVDRCVGRMPMAVASGGSRDSVGQQLGRIERREVFAAVVTAEDTRRHKPEPDVFIEAARQLGVTANRCLVFEDSHLGVEAAGRAGMDCVLIDRQRQLWLVGAADAAAWNDTPAVQT